MVASLQSKKEALEAKIRDKTSELRKLCIEEAELTGVLPVETPLEPGESPPQFRRRVGTAFTYPENLINKLRSKEDETLAALELECKIQIGIAEAAKGLANDGTATKSVRRKHRILYDESQRRLLELEARLAAYRKARENQPKQKKKPRPLTEYVADESHNEGEDVVDGGRFVPPVPALLPERNSATNMRHSHTYGGLSKQDFSALAYNHRAMQSQMHLPASEYNVYRYSLLDHHDYIVRSNNPSPVDHGAQWNRSRDMANNNQQLQFAPYPVNNGHIPNYLPDVAPISNFNERFGSLERSSQYSESSDSENRTAATLPRNTTIPHSTTASVLLPNQTYPESSLMRTQSLGNMENLKHHAERKSKKEWYETSLDSPPTVQKTEQPTVSQAKITENRCSPPIGVAGETIPEDSVHKPNQASMNSTIQFDTVVPYESPKNHTVVQAGKWQPYREVTKPFEMSDFYKYSTKYRQQASKFQSGSSPTSPQPPSVPSVQQKGVYKAPTPLECQPLSNAREASTPVPPQISNSHCYEEHQLQQHQHHQHQHQQSPDSMQWYRSKNIPKPRSSTLV
ncbi:Domain of unknown function (DUF3338) [Nesidiocoris tenuis]|uniref:Cytohesin Ubiquitin Protein Inducing domain-containing protein n=1 Tax=Nesidiocoris tenuis TaxID=355587 RepID=A0ABN7AGY7_9HEMI|nr:Domain of unknown function (DUF3338) [Nesidiocoris tenuis]